MLASILLSMGDNHHMDNSFAAFVFPPVLKIDDSISKWLRKDVGSNEVTSKDDALLLLSIELFPDVSNSAEVANEIFSSMPQDLSLDFTSHLTVPFGQWLKEQIKDACTSSSPNSLCPSCSLGSLMNISMAYGNTLMIDLIKSNVMSIRIPVLKNISRDHSYGDEGSSRSLFPYRRCLIDIIQAAASHPQVS